jgi:hypothetical protein
MTTDRPNRSTTSRGFAIYDEFTDTEGRTLCVKQSSDAESDCVWLFLTDTDSRPALSPHLNLDQARRLRDALDTFIHEQGTPQATDRFHDLEDRVAEHVFGHLGDDTTGPGTKANRITRAVMDEFRAELRAVIAHCYFTSEAPDGE